MHRAETTATGMGGSGFILGLMVGAIAAMLFTPKSGREARDILKDKIDTTRDIAEDTIKKVKRKGRDLSSNIDDEVTDYTDTTT